MCNEDPRKWYKHLKCRNCGQNAVLTEEHITCEPNVCSVEGQIDEYMYTCPECHGLCDIDPADIPDEIKRRISDQSDISIDSDVQVHGLI